MTDSLIMQTNQEKGKTMKIHNQERTILIQLWSGGTPMQLRRAIRKLKLMSGPSLAPRLIPVWLRNGKELLTNNDIAKLVAGEIQASTIHVRNLGDASSASGPNYAA